MNDEFPFRDGNALWAAVTARAKTQALETGVPAGELVRRFVIDRFLARVFALPGDEWVLKGGNATLTRVRDARATKDIDLAAEISDSSAAHAKLQDATMIDLNDHFRFVVTGSRATSGGAMQPGIAGIKVTIEAYCGAKRRDRFSVDVVSGSVMSTEPDMRSRPSLVPAIPPVSVRLYPVVDHIADKLCATQSKYGTAGDQPSSRVRDLVDLVVFALTQPVDGRALSDAIAAEWSHRRLLGSPFFDPPKEWGRTYAQLARKVPACGDTVTFDAAVSLVTDFLSPALDRTAAGRIWSPARRDWAPATDSA